MTDLNDEINVWVFFKKNRFEPWIFFWNKRRIKIEKINLVHTSKNGSTIFHHFSVSAENNFYRLRFDSKELKWFLEETEEA